MLSKRKLQTEICNYLELYVWIYTCACVCVCMSKALSTLKKLLLLLLCLGAIIVIVRPLSHFLIYLCPLTYIHRHAFICTQALSY